MLSTVFPPKPRPCKHCGKPFAPKTSMHSICSPRCLHAKARAEKAEKAAERAQDRAKREKQKGLPVLHREARTWFNRSIRLRDALQPCISCGAPPPDMTKLHAGRDAGHYRSVGSAPHLRYHPDNVHAQCVHCNQHLAGNVVAYRQGLIARIGLERLEALEAMHEAHKWTREEVRGIRDDSKALCKELEAAR